MNATHVHLDLDRLKRDYWENLNVTLRGFQPAENLHFLETWVPSDDPSDCLIDLVELARDAGLSRLSVELEEATAGGVDFSRVEAGAGQPRKSAQAGKVVLEFVLAAEPELAIHACYRAGLRQILSRVTHEGGLTPAVDQELVQVDREGVTLAAAVHPARRTVSRAAFQGTANPVWRGLLEELCAVMEGRPLQECADHGLITVESRLRDPLQPPPVAGLVTPDNADPAFALPQQLVRALLAEYQSRTGWQNQANFYDAPASPAWARQTPDQRAEAIRRELERQSLASQLELVGIEGLKRVVVRFLSPLSSLESQDLLRRLEANLRQTVEPTLHLTTQTQADTNLLRQPDKKKPSPGGQQDQV